MRQALGQRRWHALNAADLVCSRAFMVAYFAHHPPMWAASGFFPSLVFGWLRERHRGVGAPLGLHVLLNLEFFAAAAFAVG